MPDDSLDASGRVPAVAAPADRPGWRGPARPNAVALACVIVAAAVVVTTWDRYVMVLVGSVVPGWLVAPALVVVGLVLRRLDRLGQARRRPLVMRWPLTVSAALVLVVSALTGLGSLLTGTYVALDPPGPHACRVIVHETSFLMAGQGEVYLVPWGTGIGRKVGSYDSDDGGRPASTNTYALGWSGGRGMLVLHGTPGAEVYRQDLEPLTC